MVRSTLSSATNELTIRKAGPLETGANQIVVGQERVGHGLVEPEAEQHLAQLPATCLQR